MSISKLLTGTFAVALLAACSTGGQPVASVNVSPTPAVQAPATPAPSPSSTPSPVPSPSPSAFSVPRPTVPFVRCDTTALEMRLITVYGAAGTLVGTIEVRNKSSHDCDLYGYAGLQLLDAHGRALPTHVVWSPTSFFSTSPAKEAVVGLPAGTPAITPGHPVPGHAYIPITWSDVQEPCSDAAQLKVTPPDAYTSLVISAKAALFGSADIEVCSGGSLTVNPTRAAVAPTS